MPARPEVHDRLDYRTLCDAVFIKLRDEILSGALKPGQRLQQVELANRFGISRMPVRDALRKLEAEGLVTVYPGRGASVSVLDLEELQEVYRIREVLEDLATRMATPNITDEEIAALSRLEQEMEQASQRGDVGLWLLLDLKFHNSAYQPCKSPRLLKMIASFWNTTQRFRRVYVMVPGRIAHAEATHRRMLAALRARDVEEACRLIREHIRESVRGVLESQPRGFSELTEPV